MHTVYDIDSTNFNFSKFIKEPVDLFRFRNIGSQKFLDSDIKDNVFGSENGEDKYTIWKVVRNKLFYKLINGANGGFLTSRPNGEVYLTEELDSEPFQEWSISEDKSHIENRKTGFWLTTNIQGTIFTNIRSRDTDSDEFKFQEWELISFDQDLTPTTKKPTIFSRSRVSSSVFSVDKKKTGKCFFFIELEKNTYLIWSIFTYFNNLNVPKIEIRINVFLFFIFPKLYLREKNYRNKS
jgi:hypothetical protein